MTQDKKIAEVLAEFIVRQKFEDLPKDVVHETKRALLDSIGCAIGGLSMDRGKIARKLAARLGGPRESTIIGTGDKVSCENAAFVNGELINALDYDAMIGGHVTPNVLPAVLAVAESVGSSGRDLIVALVLSHEIGKRVRAGGLQLAEETITEGPERGNIKWASCCGYSACTIGAAVGAGKILNLSQEKLAHAIGIAGYICPPNTQRKWTASSPVATMKYGSPGWGAKAGVNAALLAEGGYLGDSDIFEGELGFWRYTGHEKWWPERVVENLGKRWFSREISYKQYPCGH